jgi:hypothetical protein
MSVQELLKRLENTNGRTTLEQSVVSGRSGPQSTAGRED